MKTELTKELLYQEHVVELFSAREIAKKHGWSDCWVRKQLRKLQIPFTDGHKLSGIKKRSDISSQRFGKLIAVEYISSSVDGRAEWKCLCDCGNFTVKKAKYLICGDTKSCGECEPEPIPEFVYGEIKTNARRRGIAFNVSKEYLEKLLISQNYKCKLSGIKIIMVRRCVEKNDRTASLDRIDSNLGYEEGNLQWVHKDVNYMKMNLNQDRFIELCKEIAKNHDRT